MSMLMAHIVAATLPLCDFAPRLLAKRLDTEHVASVRPPATERLDSTLYPLAVQFPASVDPTYAALILQHAETAWRVIVEEKGFLPPHADGELGGDARFDVYIATDLTPGVGGYAGFSGYNDATPRADAVGYLVIANALEPRLIRFVVAHEFFHASQMAYDWWEDMAFMEGSATWIADHVSDDEDIYWRYFPFFNAEPFKATDFISIMSPYQYGSAMFSLFLDERFGHGDTGFLRATWEGLTQDGYDNEPDFLDVITAQLAAQGTTLGAAYEEFGVWRLLVGTRARFGRYSEVGVWDARVDPWFDARLTGQVTHWQGVSRQGLQPWSHGFLGLDGTATAGLFRLTSAGGVALSLELADLTGDRAVITRLGDLDAAGGDLTVALPAAARTGERVLIITNHGDGRYDADTSPWTPTAYSFEFTASP